MTESIPNPPAPQKKQRLVFCDVLRVLAMSLIVLIHASIPFVRDMRLDGTVSWYVLLLLTVLVSWSVPAFLMLSGFLLLTREEPPGEFFRRRASRVLIPAVFWFLLIATVRAIRKNSFSLPFAELMNNTGLSFHYWFIFLIVGLYSLTPILRKMFSAKENDSWNLAYLLILTLAVSGFETVKNVFALAPGMTIYLFPATAYLGYYLIGGFFRRSVGNEVWRTGRLVPVCGVLLCVASIPASYFGILALSSGKTQMNDLLLMGYSVPSFLFGLGVFLLFLRFSERFQKIPARIQAWFAECSELSYPVFLMHTLVMAALLHGFLKNDLYALPPLGTVAFLTLGTLLVATVTAWGIRRIPGLRRVAV